MTARPSSPIPRMPAICPSMPIAANLRRGDAGLGHASLDALANRLATGTPGPPPPRPAPVGEGAICECAVARASPLAVKQHRLGALRANVDAE